jgi:hypothetical protein
LCGALDALAKELHQNNNDASIADQKEYDAWLIYNSETDGYAYILKTEGGDGRNSPPLRYSDIPAGFVAVGIWHSHANYDPSCKYNNEFSPKDLSRAAIKGWTEYVSTPDGSLQRRNKDGTVDYVIFNEAWYPY